MILNVCLRMIIWVNVPHSENTYVRFILKTNIVKWTEIHFKGVFFFLNLFQSSAYYWVWDLIYLFIVIYGQRIGLIVEGEPELNISVWGRNKKCFWDCSFQQYISSTTGGRVRVCTLAIWRTESLWCRACYISYYANIAKPQTCQPRNLGFL